jgi:putative peptidoglycan lipid II flippase
LRAVGYRWQLILSYRDEGVRQVMRMMAPAIIGSAALQVNVLVNTAFATSVSTAAVVWLSVAFRLIYLPIGMFGVAISTATLPVTSRAAALENLDEFRHTITHALRLTFLLTIPSAVGLIVLSRPIIALIYQHGRFTSFDTEQTAIALAYNAIGLTAYSAVRILAPSFYALKDTRIPMVTSLFSIVTNYAVAKLTVDYLQIGHRGLAPLAAVVMGVICLIVNRQLEILLGAERLPARLINVGVSVTIGIIVFYLIARWLRVSELDQMASALHRKFGARFLKDRKKL